LSRWGDTAREWTPPAIIRMWRRKSLQPSTNVYVSYEDALRSCGSGYDDTVISEVVVEKTRQRCADLSRGDITPDLGTLRPLIGLGLCLVGGDRPTRVLDFGGAAGYHYFITRAATSSRASFDWRVVETPAMVQAATPLAGDELTFFSTIADATRTWSSPPDLVFASGVLMCVPRPLETLAELLGLQAPHLFISRTGLSPDATTRVIVQHLPLSDNGPGPLPAGYIDRPIAYPNTFIPKLLLESAILNDYRICLRLEESVATWQAGDTPIGLYGYLCQRTAAEPVQT
jgi:putative methyltransferase (TIGR04325 family)